MKKAFLAAASLAISLLTNAADLEWTLFERSDLSGVDLSSLREIPETLGGVKGRKIRIQGSYSIERKKGAPEGLAVFFCEINAPEPRTIRIGCGADWFFELRVNGTIAFDTLKYGNTGHYPPKSTDYVTEVPLKKGKNLICILVKGGDVGLTLAVDFLPPRDYEQEKKKYSALGDVIAGTDLMADSAARKQARALIQQGVNDVRNPDFSLFDNAFDLPEDQLAEFYKQYPILRYHDLALDRILKELPSARVPKGGVILWLLYNMGYVVKTENACFGIDLHHRRAKLLAPHLDFLLTTHNHGDHYNLPLLKEMAAQGKFIVSNFYPCRGFSHGNSTIKIKDLTITMEETDHNATLKGFVKTFQIRCGEAPDSCVIYHVGDSCNEAQLNPYGKVDVFILHPHVGMKSEAACKKIRPKLTLLSHMLEMGHCWPCRWFPVPFQMVEEGDVPKIQALGLKCAIPLWGEKIVWKP